MAKTKKVTVKNEGTADSIVTPEVKVEAEPTVETKVEQAIEVKPALRSDAEQLNIYYRLLDAAPKPPEIYKLEDAPAWIDNYTRWYREVQKECPK